jgi:hypothetical protein
MENKLWEEEGGFERRKAVESGFRIPDAPTLKVREPTASLQKGGADGRD